GWVQELASAAFYEMLVSGTGLRPPPILELDRDGDILSGGVRSNEDGVDSLSIERKHVFHDDPASLRKSSVEGPQKRRKTRPPRRILFVCGPLVECSEIARLNVVIQLS